MTRPALVIVSGPPGAGKTRLARPLARRLGFPLLQKDLIKEELADAFGDGALEHSGRLGLGAIRVMLGTAQELLRSGTSVVIEAFFHHGPAEADLAPLIAISDAVLVHVTADDALLLSRYEARMTSPGRHPIHNDAGRIAELRQRLADGTCAPLDLPIPVLEVDTTYGALDVEEIAFIITAQVERRETT